ncbi:type 4 pilus major pilin [Escherichia coli]|nr:prepilin-type N-terminal cleavage/methylation domain-containing protein [Escherichia coli]
MKMQNTKTRLINSAARLENAKQLGFTLIEFMVVLALVVLVGMVSYPRAVGYYTATKVPYVADDVKVFVTRFKASTQGYGISPFEGMTQQAFARAVKNTNLQVGDISGEGATSETVRHGLGGNEAGTVVFAESGNEFTLTFAKVSEYACPDFVGQIQALGSKVTINGVSVKTTDATGNLTSAYNDAKSRGQCKDGDSNEFVLTVGTN